MTIDVPRSPVAVPVIVSCTNVPHPAGIEPPVIENARTKLLFACIKSPAAPASPPEPLLIVAPSTLNWKPPILEEVLYNTEPSAVRCKYPVVPESGRSHPSVISLPPSTHSSV